MAENRISTGEPAAPPRRLRDYRLAIRLAVCVAVLAVCAIGGVLAVVWLPWPRQWQGLAACVAAGFAGLAFLFAPLFLGIRCRDCGRRIFRAPARPSGDGATPVRYYCPTCNVEWETGLVTEPGEGKGNPGHL